LELTVKSFELSSLLKKQKLVITESLKSNENVSLFDHQILAAEKMIDEFGCNGLLADEVGLGKTVEAGIIIKELITTGVTKNTLILTPPSLVNQWQDELLSKFNLDFVAQKEDSRFTDCASHNFLIMSHSSAISEKNKMLLNKRIWDIVIVDEAHSMKNSETHKHKMVKSLFKKRLILLSATPIQNNLQELYNIVELLRPTLLGTWQEFRKKFTVDGDTRRLNPRYRSILQEIISDLVIRNTRKQVSRYIDFTDRIPHNHILPPKEFEKILYDSITEKLRELYESNFSEMIIMMYQKYISSSTASTKKALYQMKKTELISNDEYDTLLDIANKIIIDSKMQNVLDLVKTDNSKFLIFCEYHATQNYIVQVLNTHGFSTTIFNGDMNSEEKTESKKRFQDKIQVMVSTGAGGEGQNFQFCHNIINYDLPWNPMKVEQRIGRVHRIGQTHDVVIHNYVIEGTIEAFILELLYTKIELFTLTLGDLDVMFEDVSSEEISRNFFRDYMTSSDDDARDKFSVLSEEWKNNKDHVQNVIKNFNSDTFETFDLETGKK
jgi:SNF2 family DNA or RNA helicase